MLNRIPKILSPELVKVLMEMGHGDEILIADANYPAKTNNECVIRADGIGATDILKAILAIMPLDSYADYQGILMEVVPGDPVVPTIWDDYQSEVEQHFEGAVIKKMERQSFYQYSKKCFAVVQTGETALYGNLIIKKGVVN